MTDPRVPDLKNPDDDGDGGTHGHTYGRTPVAGRVVPVGKGGGRGHVRQVPGLLLGKSQ